MLQFFEDITATRPRIEEAIRKFGYAPEHNFDWYRFSADPKEKNIFVSSDQGGGLMTMLGKTNATVFSSPIAPPERRAKILIEYLEEMFCNPEIKKVEFELETPLRREFLKILPVAFMARSINFTLTWPIMNMKTFDPALPGGHYKYLRKEKNGFYREHAVTVEDAKTFEDKAGLRRIVDDWRKKRTALDRAWYDEYYNIIDGNFAGTDTARVFLVDGKPTGINAGWMIPNSERFYGAIGLHDYSWPELGDMLYLEDLKYLKSHGYGEVDMAGSWHGLLDFKKKFLPESYYKTHVFSVVRK